MTTKTTHIQQIDPLIETVAAIVAVGILLVRKLVALALMAAVLFGAFTVATRSSHGQPSLLGSVKREAVSFIASAKQNLRQSPPSDVGRAIQAPIQNALGDQSQGLIDQINQAGR